jgi:hypothetical protein
MWVALLVHLLDDLVMVTEGAIRYALDASASQDMLMCCEVNHSLTLPNMLHKNREYRPHFVGILSFYT